MDLSFRFARVPFEGLLPLIINLESWGEIDFFLTSKKKEKENLGKGAGFDSDISLHTTPHTTQPSAKEVQKKPNEKKKTNKKKVRLLYDFPIQIKLLNFFFTCLIRFGMIHARRIALSHLGPDDPDPFLPSSCPLFFILFLEPGSDHFKVDPVKFAFLYFCCSLRVLCSKTVSKKKQKNKKKQKTKNKTKNKKTKCLSSSFTLDPHLMN